MLNVSSRWNSTFNIQHSTLNIQHSSSVRIGARQGEANGVWWPPRSSKPLFRRGSVEGLVRFRHASAKKGRRQKAEGRRQKAEVLALHDARGRAEHFCLLPSAFCLIVWVRPSKTRSS